MQDSEDHKVHREEVVEVGGETIGEGTQEDKTVDMLGQESMLEETMEEIVLIAQAGTATVEAADTESINNLHAKSIS